MKYKKIDVDYSVIQEKYHTSTLVSKVLAFRNCSDEQIEELLNKNCELSKNDSPLLKQVVDRILKAKENSEKVFVGGDYDADGLCATSILVDTLNKLGIENGYYIPNRFKEGYGLHESIVRQAHTKGYRLIITVDNGVKAFDALKVSKELGIEVIILDHHEIEETPDCLYCLHPMFLDEKFQGLSGAGVTLQVSRELVGPIDLHTALACIATIGDVMQLWGENRLIVKKGLEIINQKNIPQIQLLLTSSTKVNEKDIAFQVVPKLNAVGRLQELANPNMVVKYFLETNLIHIENFARQMNELNDQRKQITLQMSVIAEKKDLSDPFLILEDERFHEGLVGLLAGKVASKYNKPTLVFTESDELVKGSGRSIKEFDMYSFFKDGFENELVAFGGHSQAIGCAIKKENFELFKSKVQAKYATYTPNDEVYEDCCLVNAKDITLSAVQEYLSLAPFGQGFKDCLFAIEQLQLTNTSLLKRKFLKLNFEDNIEAIWFDYDGVSSTDRLKIVIGEITINEFLGRKKCSLVVKNIE